ncbi:MAG: four helix bundle protein [Planctomycetota bacterium]|nr:four helix bundle protein [Planctomycetota bacterium]
MTQFRFEKLDVWHRAIDFADRIYAVTRSFPADERFGLTSQLRRAAVSISSNIAEGSSRHSDVDFARLLEIAYGSLMEVVSQLQIATRQQFVSEDVNRELNAEADRVARMLSGLRSSLLRPQNEGRPVQ